MRKRIVLYDTVRTPKGDGEVKRIEKYSRSGGFKRYGVSLGPDPEQITYFYENEVTKIADKIF